MENYNIFAIARIKRNIARSHLHPSNPDYMELPDDMDEETILKNLENF